MSEHEKWMYIQESLSNIKSDVAVVRSRIEAMEKKDNDHEERLRKVETDVSNNKLITKVGIFIATSVAGTAITLAITTLRDILS